MEEPMKVDLNSLISLCHQSLGLDFQAVAQRLGVHPVELDLAAASSNGLGAANETTVAALLSQAQAAAERTRLCRFRGLDSDALVDASKQIGDAADAKRLMAAAIEEGVDDIAASKI